MCYSIDRHPRFDMKALRITLIGAAALAATALLLLVLGIPADFLADAFKARLERETGYRLRIDGETKVGLWPAPTIFIRDVALFDPKQGDAQDRFKAESVRIALSSDGLLSGKPRVTEITIARPVLRFPLVRERVASVVAAPAAATAGVPSEPVIVDRVIIADGTVVVASGRDRVETRLDRINLDASLGSTDGRVELRGGLYWGDQLLRVELKADDWARWLDGQTIPVEFALQAPGLMAEPVSATAELRSRNALLSVNGLRGKIGRNSFHGWASVDFAATKPMP